MIRRLIVIAGFALSGAMPGSAQDAPPGPFADFTVEGAVTVGHRWIDVDGRRAKFDELFNLRNGFRLHDFSLSARADSGRAFADSITLAGFGLGGEPASGARLRMRRPQRYDFGLEHRQSYYYWDRPDEAPHPGGLAGLTSHHDYATVRRLGAADFTYQVTPRLRAGVEYTRREHRGRRVSTRALEYLDAPAAWAAFMRANAFVVEAPADARSDRGALLLAYVHGSWSLRLRAGYQESVETLDRANLAEGKRSIAFNPGAADERLDAARWRETRRAGTPFSEFSYSGQPHARIGVRGGYIHHRPAGPFQTEGSFEGVARTNAGGSAVGPFAVALSADGRSEESSHVLDQGVTVEWTRHVRLHSDYRYSRFTLRSHARLSSRDAGGPAAGEERREWRQGLHALDLALEVAPTPRLLLRPGVRFLKRDTTLRVNGVADPAASRPSRVTAPIFSVYYAPSARLRLQGDVRSATNDGPYTRITPRTDRSGRIVARYAPAARLQLENSFTFRNAAYPTTAFEHRTRSNATTLTYAVRDDLRLLAGFTYDSFLATARVEFLRGAPPLAAEFRDQAVHRVVQAGVDATPLPRLALRLTGNYVRTTGAGELSDEPPTSGPVRWPMITGTAAFEIPGSGTLSLDVQRTYYLESIMPGDNFSANVLAIRWTKEF